MDYVLIILNLILLESVLSIDNAAILAVMVGHLPHNQQPKALKYGIWGAFIFRGLCLILAAWLVKIIWLKIVGGLYLLYLVYKHFFGEEKESNPNAWGKSFWGTVLAVEIMDLSFSIDNIFAAVALTDNIYLIMIGVFIGIIAMRYVAQQFIWLMEKYPSLKQSVYYVIWLLGMKLVLSGLGDYFDLFAPVNALFNSHYFDLCFSSITVLIFVLPLIFDHFKLKKNEKNSQMY